MTTGSTKSEIIPFRNFVDSESGIKALDSLRKRLNDAKLSFQSMKHQRRENSFFLEHSISVEFNPKRKPRKTVTAVSRSYNTDC